MAITIVTQPEANHSAFAPVFWKVSSNLVAAGALVEIDAIGNQGGNISVEFATNHGMVVNDTSVFSGTLTGRYNVVQVISPTIIVINKAYTTPAITGYAYRANPNFKMKAEIIVAAVTIATLYKSPIGIEFSCDISGILKTLISTGYGSLGANINVTINQNIPYIVKFTETHENASGAIIERSNLSSNTKTGYMMNKNVTWLNYTMQAGQVAKTFSNMPVKSDMVVANNKYLTYFKGAGTIYLQLYSVVNGDDEYQAIIITATGQNIINIGATGAGTTYREAWFSSDSFGANKISETYKFSVKPSCDVVIHWKGLLGGHETYHFKRVEDTFSYSAQTFKKPLQIGYTDTSRQRTNYKTDGSQVFTIASDFVNDETAEWLTELFISPEHFILENNTLIPIIILSGEQLVRRTDEMVSVQIKYIKSQDLITLL